MNIAIIGDEYPPARTSIASMLDDLALEFVKHQHKPIIIVPDAIIDSSLIINYDNGIQVIRIKYPNTKNINYIKRAILEFIMPFVMFYRLKKSNSIKKKIDGIVWYSPSIFYGPLVYLLKKQNKCPSYLILRDIFPQWAVDLGIIKKRLPYLFLKMNERFQYFVADRIGIQSPSNRKFLPNNKKYDEKIEILYNWLSETKTDISNIDIKKTNLANRIIFVYTGNMGVAQGLRGLLPTIKALDKINREIGFIFTGNGEDAGYISEELVKNKITNTLVLPDIPHNQLKGFYDQCHFGIVSLDFRHKTHNIPGKFISYIKNQLPVLAFLNEGNDLHEIINSNKIGRSFSSMDKEEIINGINEMIKDVHYRGKAQDNCFNLSNKLFSSYKAYLQIETAIKSYKYD